MVLNVSFCYKSVRELCNNFQPYKFAWFILIYIICSIKFKIHVGELHNQCCGFYWFVNTPVKRSHTVFYFFYKIIIFTLNKEKDGLRSTYCKLSQLGDSQTTLLTSFSCFITLWKHTCRPIKTHILSKLFFKNQYVKD